VQSDDAIEPELHRRAERRGQPRVRPRADLGVGRIAASDRRVPGVKSMSRWRRAAMRPSPARTASRDRNRQLQKAHRHVCAREITSDKHYNPSPSEPRTRGGRASSWSTAKPSGWGGRRAAARASGSCASAAAASASATSAATVDFPPSPKRRSHSDVPLNIILVIIPTKYTGMRQNVSNV
jgi:hypothetical protein